MRLLKAAVGTALVLSLCALPAAAGDDVPEWPSEQEKALQDADSSLLDLQRQRFHARLAGDEEAVKRLDRRFKKLQEERNRLLHATGRR